MDLVEVIQTLMQNGIKELKLTDLIIGTVVTPAPLSIMIDASMPPIPEIALIKTVGVMPKSYSGKTSDGASFTVVINEGLQAGQKVIMLRVSGGQQFIVLSKAY
jgi:hypothetical protein